MKKVSKKEPAFFSEFITKEKPNNWEEIIHKGLGQKIREFILQKEQNYQCAYTEISINSDRLSSHIDHYRKRSLFANYIFDWNNLFVATINENYGAKHKDKQISNKNIGIYELLLNPAIDNPLDYFYYSTTGFISPKSKNENSSEYKKAMATIDFFNLNHKDLVNRRGKLSKNLDSYNNQFKLNELLELINEFDSYVKTIYPSLNQNNPSKN